MPTSEHDPDGSNRVETRPREARIRVNPGLLVQLQRRIACSFFTHDAVLGPWMRVDRRDSADRGGYLQWVSDPRKVGHQAVAGPHRRPVAYSDVGTARSGRGVRKRSRHFPQVALATTRDANRAIGSLQPGRWGLRTCGETP